MGMDAWVVVVSVGRLDVGVGLCGQVLGSLSASM
jgi:hypothetical protein